MEREDREWEESSEKIRSGVGSETRKREEGRDRVVAHETNLGA